jgi:hypothetical protein
LVEAPRIRYAISALLTLEIPMIPQGEQVFAEAENVAAPTPLACIGIRQVLALGGEQERNRSYREDVGFSWVSPVIAISG